MGSAWGDALTAAELIALAGESGWNVRRGSGSVWVAERGGQRIYAPSVGQLERELQLKRVPGFGAERQGTPSLRARAASNRATGWIVMRDEERAL